MLPAHRAHGDFNDSFKNKRDITIYTLIFFSSLTIKSQYQMNDVPGIHKGRTYLGI